MRTWIEIDKKAILHNIKKFKKIVGKKTLLMPVVKGNAYGHGIVEIAKICDKSNDVGAICVVDDNEAITLLKNNIKKQIFIIGFFDLIVKKSLKLAKKNVVFPVYSFKQARFLNRVGELNKVKVKIHLKFDVGTTRIGFFENQIKEIKLISKLNWIEINGVYSHLASSESDTAYTKQQLKKFDNILLQLKKSGIDPPLKHISCSAAAILFKNSHYNAARVGLGVYGLYSSNKMKKRIKLIPALSMYTKVIQVKKIKKGTKIGYGGTYAVKKDTQIAVLPVGYWDGYDRRLSNQSNVIINNKKCHLRGNVCMNLIMVELPSNNNIKTGDKATLIESKSRNKIDIDWLSKKCETINYEFVSRLNPQIPRIFVR